MSSVNEANRGGWKKFPNTKRKDIKILDYGCGRGRSVAKLRDKGFDAYGVDIDHKVLSNGFQLFSNRNLIPQEILKPVEEINDFEDSSFHLIFSEQVFEHVSDLPKVIMELSRLTKIGGFGFHKFPGAFNFNEAHLNMPLVHWLPKNFLRKILIVTFLINKKGPLNTWPEVKNTSLLEVAEVYYRNMLNYTSYRENIHISNLFNKFGFSATYKTRCKKNNLRRFIPSILLANGFPDGAIEFDVCRTELLTK